MKKTKEPTKLKFKKGDIIYMAKCILPANNWCAELFSTHASGFVEDANPKSVMFPYTVRFGSVFYSCKEDYLEGENS